MKLTNRSRSLLEKKKASSLLIVILIVAGISVVILATAKITYLQYQQSNYAEDSIQALQAAKAGIEQGLIMFRHDRNVDTLDETTDPNKPVQKVQRYDLNDGTVAGNPAPIGNSDPTIPRYLIDEFSPLANDNAFKYNPAHQVYDLKIQYKVNSVPDPIIDWNDSTKFSNIAKDQTLTLTGFSKTKAGTDYYLRYKIIFDPNNVCSPSDLSNSLVQIQTIEEKTNTYNQTTIKYSGANDGPGVYDSSKSSNLLIGDKIGALISTVRITPYYCPIKIALQTVGDNINSTAPADVLFDPGSSMKTRTVITSTGYYGRAKRTYIAEIDPNSGLPYSIYEYTLFSGKDIAPK